MQSTNTHTEFQDKGYAKIAAEGSGHMQDSDKWYKAQQSRQSLTEQTHHIASQLEKEGIDAYQDQDLYIFGLNSKGIKKVENFRNIHFLPLVAQKNRAKTLKTLEYYLKQYPNARTSVLTSGKRCGLTELRDRCRTMHRKVSKINSMPWMQEVGARFVFRSTELGEIVPIGDDISVHPHCHLIFVLDKFITREKWSNLLKQIRAYFGTHYEDCGKLKNVRELVKYCVKPTDFQYLGSKHIAKLYHATKRLRFVECLKDLRVMKRSHKDNRKKLVRSKGVLKLVDNWVGGKAPDDVPRYLQGRCVDDPSSPQLVAWCAPARVFTPVTEPMFLVHGLGSTDPAKVFSWLEVKRMQSAIRVHTKTLTVSDRIDKNVRRKKNIYEDTEKIPDIPIHA
jgi:hypothetical protein